MERKGIKINNLAATMSELFKGNPDAKQMVFLQNEGVPVGHFGVSLVQEGGINFIQIENVYPPELAESIAQLDPRQGEDVIGGIYRIPYTPKE